MEIGISSDQLIDISLNFTGFLAAGTLLMLVRSVLIGRNQRPLPESSSGPEKELEDKSSSRNRLDKDSEATLEYVNLRGVDRKEREQNQSSSPGENFRSRNRREIIRMAQEMLAGRGKAEAKNSFPNMERELSRLQQNINLQGAGRSG